MTSVNSQTTPAASAIDLSKAFEALASGRVKDPRGTAEAILASGDRALELFHAALEDPESWTGEARRGRMAFRLVAAMRRGRSLARLDRVLRLRGDDPELCRHASGLIAGFGSQALEILPHLLMDRSVSTPARVAAAKGLAILAISHHLAWDPASANLRTVLERLGAEPAELIAVVCDCLTRIQDRGALGLIREAYEGGHAGPDRNRIHELEAIFVSGHMQVEADPIFEDPLSGIAE